MNLTSYNGINVAYWMDFIYFLSASGVLITGYWVITGLKENLNYAYTPEQIKSLRYMEIGSLLAFIVGPITGFPGYLFLRFSDNVGLGLFLFYVLGYGIISIGVFLLAFTYKGSKEISFLLPQKIEKLLVIHNSGVSIYSYDFGIQVGSKWND